MNNKFVAIALLTLCICACSPQTVPSNKGLGPAVTTHTSDRSETGPLSGTENEFVEQRVAVHSIDYKTRVMTVRNYHDMLETYTISPVVKRLNDIKPGDRIAVSLLRSVAFEVRKPTAEELVNPTAVGINIKKNPLSLPPGIAAGALKHMIVTVDEIDFKTNAVTVKLPEGKRVTTYAHYPENLSRVKVGDTVAVTYGEAVVVNVKPIS